MRATMKYLNDYLFVYTDLYEFVKGDGYFYFSHNPDAPMDTPEPPESIYVFALHQMSREKWCEHIRWNLKDWHEKTGIDFKSGIKP